MKSNQNTTKLFALTFYAVVLPFIVGIGIVNDDNNSLAAIGDRRKDRLSAYISVISILLIVYLIRWVMLTLPFWSNRDKWAHLFKPQLYALGIPEIITVSIGFKLLLESPASCQTSQEFGNCGFGTLIFAIVALSAILQTIGLIIGYLNGPTVKKLST